MKKSITSAHIKHCAYICLGALVLLISVQNPSYATHCTFSNCCQNNKSPVQCGKAVKHAQRMVKDTYTNQGSKSCKDQDGTMGTCKHVHCSVPDSACYWDGGSY